jgi:hypothetical protein
MKKWRSITASPYDPTLCLPPGTQSFEMNAADVVEITPGLPNIERNAWELNAEQREQDRLAARLRKSTEPRPRR